MRVQLGGLAAAMSVQLWRCPEYQDILEYIIASGSFSELSRELPTVSVDVNCTNNTVPPT